MTGMYILDGKVPVLCSDVVKWASQPQEDKIVARSQFGESVVSTVFLSIDHSFDGLPILFETMIFGGEYDQYQERYCTWDEAEEGHKVACELINKISIDREKKLNNLGV